MYQQTVQDYRSENDEYFFKESNFQTLNHYTNNS